MSDAEQKLLDRELPYVRYWNQAVKQNKEGNIVLFSTVKWAASGGSEQTASGKME